MWKSETLSYFVILNESNFFSIGANACVKLKQFEEAIIWCEKGLAVSFLREHKFHSTILLLPLFRMGQYTIFSKLALINKAGLV